jgi:hypothetical protein
MAYHWFLKYGYVKKGGRWLVRDATLENKYRNTYGLMWLRYNAGIPENEKILI